MTLHAERIAPEVYGPTYVDDWRDLAACHGMDPHLFFGPEEGREDRETRQLRIANAKAICAGCPVRADCLDFAVKTDPQPGIFGGLTELERDFPPHRDRRPKPDHQTHCCNGHLFTEENVYLYRGKRFCRECRRKEKRLRREERRTA